MPLPEEIVFTSGATESNNLAIQGVASAAKHLQNNRKRIVTLGTEHSSIIEPCKELERRGFELLIAPVDRYGIVILDELGEILGDDTLLFCIQAANNEIGTIQPMVSAIAKAHLHGALVHCDAAQAIGKISFDVEQLDLDLVSISSHKCYGPKGVGALWMRGGPSRFPILPLFYGGSHERKLRPGTLNTIGIAGFGEAVRIATQRLEGDSTHIKKVRDHFEARLQNLVPEIQINGALGHRLPGLSSITFENIEADALISSMPEFDLSAASACHSGTPEPSHVLRAIGLSNEQAYRTLRVSFGRETTLDEADFAVTRMAEVVQLLRNYSTGNTDSEFTD